MANEELKAKLTADSAQMQKALGEVEKSTEKAGQKLQDLSTKTKQSESAFGRLASKLVTGTKALAAGVMGVVASVKQLSKSLLKNWLDDLQQGVDLAKEMTGHLQTIRGMWAGVRNRGAGAINTLLDLGPADTLEGYEQQARHAEALAVLRKSMEAQGRGKEYEALATSTGDKYYEALAKELNHNRDKAIKDAEDAVKAQQVVVNQLDDQYNKVANNWLMRLSDPSGWESLLFQVQKEKNAATDELLRLQVAAKDIANAPRADAAVEIQRAKNKDRDAKLAADREAAAQAKEAAEKAAADKELERNAKLERDLLALQEDSYHKRLQLVEMELDAKLKAMEAEGYAEEQLLRYREARMEAFYRKEADRAAQEDRDNLLGARAGILEDLNKIKGEYGFTIGQVKIAGGLLDRWSPDQTSSDRAAIRRADREARKTGRLDERIADKLASGRKLTTREQARADELYKIEKATAMDQPWSTRTVQELLNSLDSIKAQVFVVKGSNK